MKSFYMGIDVSKGYADFMIINRQKKSVTKAFQLDDTFEGHQRLYNVISRFLAKHPDATCLPVWRAPVVMRTTGSTR